MIPSTASRLPASFSALRGRPFSARGLASSSSLPSAAGSSRLPRPASSSACRTQLQCLARQPGISRNRRIRRLPAHRAVQGHRVVPELRRIRRPTSHQDTLPRISKIHCQSVHTTGVASSPARHQRGHRPQPESLLCRRRQLPCVPHQFIHTAINDPKPLPFRTNNACWLKQPVPGHELPHCHRKWVD